MADQAVPESLAPALLERGYRIEGEIGRGGMGIVLRATQLSLQRAVAIKVLLSTLSSPGDLIRFRSEGRSLLRVQHPNVVRVIDVCTDPPFPYLVLEYIADAVPLSAWMRGAERSDADRMRVVTEMIDGLAAVHHERLIHRDLKPDNVLVDAAGTARLIDFGLARPLTTNETRATQSGAVLGTLAYMSPEQLRGEEVDLTSDVYALGLVAMEVLSRRFLFSGDAAAEDRCLYFDRVARGAPNILRWCSHLDPRVTREIARCVQEQPATRPQSAVALQAVWPATPRPAIASGAVTERLNEPPRPVRRRSPSAAVIAPPVPSPGPRPEPSTSMAPRYLAAGAVLVVMSLAIALRPRTVADPPAAASVPANVRAAKLTLSGTRLILRVELDAPAVVTLHWQGAGKESRALSPATTHEIDVSAPELEKASDLHITADGADVDLDAAVARHAAALSRSLETISVEPLIRRISVLRARGQAATDVAADLRNRIPAETRRLIAVSGPVIRSWLPTTTDLQQRSILLPLLYRLELLDEFALRSGVLDLTGVRRLFPPTWLERSYGGQSANNPRLQLKAADRQLDPARLEINGVPAENKEPVFVSASWSYVPFRCNLTIDRRQDTVQKSFFKSADDRTQRTRTLDLRIELTAEVVRSHRELTVCMVGRSTGDSVLWASINGALRVPFFLGGAEPNKNNAQIRDCLRTVNASVLRVGQNDVRLSIEPFPGVTEVDPVTLHFLLLIPGKLPAAP